MSHTIFYIIIPQQVPNCQAGQCLYSKSQQATDCWFTVQPLGHDSLTNIVQNMCKQAGISGYKTNHSLRVTTATRFYQASIDEQLIMKRMGHCSLDGVRCCKRTGDKQRQMLSYIVNLSVPPVKANKFHSVIYSSFYSTVHQQYHNYYYNIV